MIKNIKLNFLLLLLTCGLAIQCQPISLYKKISYSCGLITSSLAVANYLSDNKKYLSKGLYNLLKKEDQREYSKFSTYCHLSKNGPMILSLINGLSLYYKFDDALSQTVSSFMTIGIIFHNQYKFNYAKPFKNADLRGYFFYKIKHTPTKEHFEKLLNNGVDVNEKLSYTPQRSHFPISMI